MLRYLIAFFLYLIQGQNRRRMDTIEKIPLRYGLATAAVIMLYFLTVHFAGFARIFELRIVDLLILAVGVYFATVQYKHKIGAHVTYFKIFLTGVLTGFVITIAYALFLFFYLMFADAALMETYVTGPYGTSVSPYTIAIIAVAMGASTGFLASFVSVNLMKTEAF